MNKIYILLFIVFSAFNLSQAQQVEVIKVDGLEELINAKSDKIKVINFWATWCGPCVKELPLFEKAHVALADKIEVNLISVDYLEELEKVKKFAARKSLASSLWLIDEVDGNVYIDKVDKRWSGAIPATLIVNTQTGERKFYEGELHEGQLEQMIKELTK